MLKSLRFIALGAFALGLLAGFYFLPAGRVMSDSNSPLYAASLNSTTEQISGKDQPRGVDGKGGGEGNLITCEVTCGPTCNQTTCGTTCVSTCVLTCTNTCNQTTCSSTCVATCAATCANTCSQPTCAATCMMSCSYTCWSPISLIGFEGHAVDSRVILRWSTGSEIDNHSFVIERSTSLEGSFAEIAQISAQGGVGTREYTYVDANVQTGQTYFYRLVDVSIYGYPTVHADNIVEVTLAGDFRLAQNYPNPFNPTTAIRYQLSADSYVSLNVYDAAGRLVSELVDGWREAGHHQIAFDGSALPSGIYFARLQAGKFSQAQKMVLMK
jgi:hypothetical protein